jgi:tetratricopeptide (TPR) repeat protein
MSIDPDSLEALAGLTAVDLLGKNVGAAKARIDARLQGPNPRPELLLLAARTYGSAGDLDGAEKLLKRAIEADGSLLPAYALLGQLYYSQRKIDQALKEFDTLAQRQSNPVAALTMMGVIHQGEGNLKEGPSAVRAGDCDRPACARRRQPTWPGCIWIQAKISTARFSSRSWPRKRFQTHRRYSTHSGGRTTKRAGDVRRAAAHAKRRG